MSGAVKLNDVARAAGVSIKTVSRVVTGQGYVKEETRAVVQAAIAQLGYRPNLLARSLKTSRSFLLAAISPRLESFYFHTLHSRSYYACKERGFHLVIEEITPGNPQALNELEHNLSLIRFEGVILNAPLTEDAGIMAMLERLNLRYVRISPSSNLDRSDFVAADESHGMKLLAQHFWSLGHRRIGVAAGPPQLASARRHAALSEAFVELGARPEDIQTVAVNWHAPAEEAGRQLAALMLTAAQRPTAIFAFTDEVAAGVIAYALEHGLRVPEDLSVAGFDGSDLSRVIWPPLTTIRLPIDQMTRAAVSLLLEPSSDQKARQVTCPVELVVRKSTGPASGAIAMTSFDS